MTDTRPIRILYFAWLREQIGQSEEQVVIQSAISVRECIDRLVGQGPAYQTAFRDLEPIRVAINQQLATFDDMINPGDELALFPPVTGG